MDELKPTEYPPPTDSAAAASLRCVCHVTNTGIKTVKPFSERRWNKLCCYMQLWKDLDGLEQSVAENFDVVMARKEGFHQRCFDAFTDGYRIQRAQERFQVESIKTELFKNAAEDTAVSTIESPLIGPCRQLRQCRSMRGLPTDISRCVICLDHKPWKSDADAATTTNLHEPVVRCESKNVMLRKAAEKRKDEQLLRRIQEHEEVGIAVLCHKSCHLKYVSCVKGKAHNGKTERENGVNVSSGDAVFEQFCAAVIDRQVIGNGQVLSVKTLERFFSARVKQTRHSLDTANAQIKPRLMQKYGESLVFFRPNVNRSQVVISVDFLLKILTIPDSDEELRLSDLESDHEDNAGLFSRPEGEHIHVKLCQCLMVYFVLFICLNKIVSLGLGAKLLRTSEPFLSGSQKLYSTHAHKAMR